MNMDEVSQQAGALADQARNLAEQASMISSQQAFMAGPSMFVISLTIFVLACFVGYYVVWKVTPALHTPLMAVTNAISGIIIVGAMIAAGMKHVDVGGESLSGTLGFWAVLLASINIFGGFLVTQRMLQMFKKKAVADTKGKGA
ncbi:NAD(P) transhydrogenase subunit alpha [bacterium]|nr:NAD(P) transhydrogenase subunit alpha [bacterium]